MIFNKYNNAISLKDLEIVGETVLWFVRQTYRLFFYVVPINYTLLHISLNFLLYFCFFLYLLLFIFNFQIIHFNLFIFFNFYFSLFLFYILFLYKLVFSNSRDNFITEIIKVNLFFWFDTTISPSSVLPFSGHKIQFMQPIYLL